MFFLGNFGFLMIMKVQNCVFFMVFDVWICSMIWEVINGCVRVVGGLNRALFW